MTTIEKYAIGMVVIAIVAMVLYDQRKVKSGAVPLIAQTEDEMAKLDASIVGMSNIEQDPEKSSLIKRKKIRWGYPLPLKCRQSHRRGRHTRQERLQWPIPSCSPSNNGPPHPANISNHRTTPIRQQDCSKNHGYCAEHRQ